MRFVNQPIRKKDAMALVTGKPVYTGDMVPKNALFYIGKRKNSWQRGVKR